MTHSSPPGERASEAPVVSDESDFGGYFVSAYPPFRAWTAEQVGGLEPRLARRPASVPLGLYVHVPFCEHRCHYCYYFSHDDRAAERERYLAALTAELELYARAPLLAGRALDFAYFGGGTPSLLTPDQIERLFADLAARVPWSAVREVTFECAPRSVTEVKARVLRNAGVNRVSLGVQQLDDGVLAENGRIHRVADVERAYSMLRQAGFPVVNIDLIVGLVGESEATFQRSLARVIELAPECVTLYQLEIPHNTPLYRRLRAEPAAARPASWPEKQARLTRGFERLRAAGYELRSAYTAAAGARARQFVYQDELYAGADLLGLGASSFSYLDGLHFQNHARLESYFDALSRGLRPVARAYDLDADERLVREFVLQLKLLRVPLAPLRARFGARALDSLAEPLRRLEAAGWLALGEGAVTVTAQGLPRIDRLLREFY